MRIRIQVEKNKGHIPGDKITKFGMAFENAPLSHWLGEQTAETLISLTKTALEDIESDYGKNLLRKLKKNAKEFLVKSEKVKKAQSAGHSTLYLNFNVDGIDCFINR